MPVGCGNGGRTGSQTERSSYLLVSSSLTGTRTAANTDVRQSALTTTTGLAPCTIAGTAGLCLTPTQARGKVVSLSLVQTVMETPPVRLFGTGEGLDRDGRISLAGFDLANPVGIPARELCKRSNPARHSRRWTRFWGTSTSKFPWTTSSGRCDWRSIRSPSPPIRVVMCSDAHRIETIAKNGAVIDGAPDFARGDVMYCQKGAASDECAPTDFSWMDSASHAFVTTRPASPHRLDALVDRTSLSATINYDLGEFVFFPGITDAASATPEALLNVVTLAPIHGRQVLGPGPGGGAFSSATLTLMLGHEASPSCGGPTEGPDGGTATGGSGGQGP